MRLSAEQEFLLALGTWDALQDKVIPDRLDHVKIRKHTRHWEGEGAGTKALDPQYAVEMNRWVDDIKSQTASLMRRVATEAAREAARDMVRTGITNAMHARGKGSRQSRSAMGKVFGSTQAAQQAVTDVLRPVESVVTDAAKRQSARVMDRIREMDVDGASMVDIKREIRDMIGQRSSWRQTLSRYLTTSLTEGAKEAAYAQAGNLVTKRWVTRADEKVRRSHRAVDGKEIPLHRKFRVGKSWMSRPGDPRGSVEETINCRCELAYDINPAQGAFYDEHAGGVR